MCKSFDVTARALRRAFGPSEQLYRDHRGHRVLMDLEGSGDFRIEQSTVSLQICADGRLFEGPSSFARNLLISTRETGSASVAVRTGTPSGKRRTVPLPHSACGWVLSCAGQFQADGTHEAAPTPDGFLAVPFFLRVDGQGMAEIMEIEDIEGVQIDCFDIDDVDALRARGWRVQNISKVSTLESGFSDGTQRTGPVASHLNAASWLLDVPENSAGLRIRRYYDRFHGRQRARVLVNGEMAGWWYDPDEDRKSRWAISDFGIPRELLAPGKNEITIDPPAGSPLWSVGRIEMFSFQCRL